MVECAIAKWQALAQGSVFNTSKLGYIDHTAQSHNLQRTHRIHPSILIKVPKHAVRFLTKRLNL